jgi:hypothetical protein
MMVSPLAKNLIAGAIGRRCGLGRSTIAPSPISRAAGVIC